MEMVYNLSDYLIEMLAENGVNLDENQSESVAESIVNKRKETLSLFNKIKG